MAFINPAEAAKDAFHYMRADSHLSSPVDLTFVFGNGGEQQLIAEKAAQVYAMQRAMGSRAVMVCTGGIGKGSVRLDTSEAVLLRNQLIQDFGLPRGDIYAEQLSRNAGDNCRNGMRLILGEGLPHGRIALVAHALAMRRIRAVFELEASLIGFETEFFNCPTDRLPDFDNRLDQLELLGEIIKVVDWPEHDPSWSQAQTPAPSDELLAYARAQVAMHTQ